MAIIYGESEGIFNFHDTSFGKHPDGGIEVSKDLHEKLVLVRSKGAVLSIENGSIIAKTHDGSLVDLDNIKDGEVYHAPVSLQFKAKGALVKAREYIYNHYSILNEQTPAEWVVYIKELMAISSGVTVVSELPSGPERAQVA